jgi:regulatory protein
MALDTLRTSEVERAREVWRKKFGGPAQDAAGRAKQMRFLAGRGFGGDAIRRVVSGADDDL